MFQCRGVAYWHWISLPSIGVIVHQAEWKGGKAAVPSQQMDTKYVHDLSAQWLTVRNNTPPHGWDIFMKMHLLKKEQKMKKKRERLLCLKPNSTDESIKQLKLTSACYMDSINASRWSYNNSASCWWTVERRVGVPEMCCIAFEISQMHLNQISQLRKYFILIIISYSTTWVIFKFYLCNQFT